MVPIWSTATAGGIPLVKLAGLQRHRSAEGLRAHQEERRRGIKLKGGAGWAVALSIAEVIHPIALNQPKVLPVSHAA